MQRRRTEGRTSESHGDERMEGMANGEDLYGNTTMVGCRKAKIKQVIEEYCMLKKQSEMAEEERLENDLEELNRIVEPDQNTLRKIHSIESTLRDAQLQKAERARIRARVKHATEGERNTAFFFRQEKQHAQAKTVSQVRTGSLLEELHKALMGMQGGKSPGIDGLPKEFYVAFWQLVGEDLNQVLQRSIEQGELPLSMRRAVISPIFKKGEDAA